MAKSIRSKVKKRNRTEMRKTVGDPHQKILQARCTAKIQKSVAFSAGERTRWDRDGLFCWLSVWYVSFVFLLKTSTTVHISHTLHPRVTW